jgi:uncharacterized protein YbcI
MNRVRRTGVAWVVPVVRRVTSLAPLLPPGAFAEWRRTRKERPRMTTSEAITGSALPGAISNSLALVWRDHTGRKPQGARTYIREDLVVCLLRGGMSPYEKQLIGQEENPLVWTMREHMRTAVERDEVAEVERLTGRRVTSFLSDQDTKRDLAAELFLLEPASAN